MAHLSLVALTFEAVLRLERQSTDRTIETLGSPIEEPTEDPLTLPAPKLS